MHRVRLQVRLLTSFTICTGLAGTTTLHTFALPRFWPCSRPLRSFPLRVRPFVLKGLALNLSLLSRYLTTSETAHLLRQSSSWLHWLEPTRIIEVSCTSDTRASQEFPRSEPSFVTALGWYFTPGYFSCESRSSYRDDPPLLDSGHKTIHLSPIPILVRPLNPRRPVWPHDASNIPFLRSHSSQLAGIASSDLRHTYIPARFPA